MAHAAHLTAEPVKKAAVVSKNRRAQYGIDVAPSALMQVTARKPALQRKLVIGHSQDPAEIEAEAVAKHYANENTAAPNVAAAPANGGEVQRATEEDEGERPGEFLLQPDRLDASGPLEPPEDFAQRWAMVRTGGQPLPGALRAEMEGFFGTDFGDVRVHQGPLPGELARAIHARAFTERNHIAFADGQFQPATATGKALVAHELTHVVQQRQSPGLPVQRDFGLDIDFDIDLSIDLSGQIRSLLKRVAPEVEPIIMDGPLGWLKDKLGSVFDGIIEMAGNFDPKTVLDELIESFKALVERGTEIVKGLSQTDCQPLFDALEKFKSFILAVAGNAWDKIADFFEPVTSFAQEVWDGISAAGSAAIDWLKQAAGQIWSDIEEIGRFIWDKTEPVRDLAETAWNWVKDKLFGPGEDKSQGNSQGGIIGWFSDKAGEAFGYIQEKTKPVWQPIADAIETVKSIIPPPFIAELGDKMTSFSEKIDQTTAEMDQGGTVAENREALAGIMPSIGEVMSFVREKIVAAGTFVTSTVTTISTKVGDFMRRLKAETLISAIARQLEWLETGINRVSNWASEGAVALFNKALAIFDFLRPFIERLIEVVGKTIEFVGNIAMGPVNLIKGAWNLIPECIREPIKNFFIEQILGRIPIFNQFLKIGKLWTKLQETALTILKAVFVDGDFAKAIWTYFKTLLGLIGLPAQLVVQILTKALTAYGLILQNPIGFLINTLKAMKEGFVLFFKNILKHLFGGIMGWLFGHVRDAGLTPPTEFSLKGVIGFVFQILDITVQRVMERLAAKIGKDKVERIKDVIDKATGVWEFVSVLIKDGVAGLWRFLTEKLSNLWTLVLNSVVGWVTQKIIETVSARLLALLDPSGIMAVINSAIMIYRAIESFVEQLKAMLEIISKVLDGIKGIATGAIEQAAQFLEKALAQSLPVAIAFLANQAGLGGLAKRIQEFVEAVREKVNAGIDWLIDKGIKAGQGFLSLLKKGAGAVKDAVGAVIDWWRARKAFKNKAGENHEVYIEGQGAHAKPMIKSTPQTYGEFLTKNKGTLDTSEKQKAYDQAVIIAKSLDGEIAAAATAANAGVDPADGKNHADAIQSLLNNLANKTAIFMPAVDRTKESSAPIFGGMFNASYGTSASVPRLWMAAGKPKVSSGQPADKAPQKNYWDVLKNRASISGSLADGYYVRGHILSEKLGGPASWENLTPLTQDANNRADASHEKMFESKVKAAARDGGVNFVCTVNYGRSGREADAKSVVDDDTVTLNSHYDSIDGPKLSEIRDKIAQIIREEKNVPNTLDCSAFTLNDDGSAGSKIASGPVANSIVEAIETYRIKETHTRKEKLDINGLNDVELSAKLMTIKAVGKVTIEKIQRARPGRVMPFRNFADLENIVGPAKAKRIRGDFIVEYKASISDAAKENLVFNNPAIDPAAAIRAKNIYQIGDKTLATIAGGTFNNESELEAAIGSKLERIKQYFKLIF